MEVNRRQVIYDFIRKSPFLLGFMDLISGLFIIPNSPIKQICTGYFVKSLNGSTITCYI